MIYLDTSVLLAHLLAEDRHPPESLWAQTLVSSRLLEIETWTRLHARGLATSHGPAAEEILRRVAFVEIGSLVVERVVRGWPLPVRTLDAIHLASASVLVSRRQPVRVATYDVRLRAAAEAVGLQLADV